LATHFNIPATVLLNKSDLSPAQTAAITGYCSTHGIPLVGRLPYDPAVTDAMVRGEPVTTTAGPVADALREAWSMLQATLFVPNPSEER